MIALQHRSLCWLKPMSWLLFILHVAVNLSMLRGRRFRHPQLTVRQHRPWFTFATYCFVISMNLGIPLQSLYFYVLFILKYHFDDSNHILWLVVLQVLCLHPISVLPGRPACGLRSAGDFASCHSWLRGANDRRPVPGVPFPPFDRWGMETSYE